MRRTKIRKVIMHFFPSDKFKDMILEGKEEDISPFPLFVECWHFFWRHTTRGSRKMLFVVFVKTMNYIMQLVLMMVLINTVSANGPQAQVGTA